MNCFQLACGHWQSEGSSFASYGIGDILGCVKCNTMRTLVIGFSAAPIFGLEDA